MTNGMVRGQLVGVVDGPKMILEINGQERSYPLAADLTPTWVMDHMEKTIIAKLQDGEIVEVG